MMKVAVKYSPTNKEAVNFIDMAALLLNKKAAIQPYEKILDLSKMEYIDYGQFVVDAPRKELNASIQENIYKNYDVIGINFVTYNILAEMQVRGFDKILIIEDDFIYPQELSNIETQYVKDYMNKCFDVRYVNSKDDFFTIGFDFFNFGEQDD